jgi:hypothetical protein
MSGCGCGRLQKRTEKMVIMNKKRGCGTDIFSKFFAAYMLAFFVDSARM